MHGFLLTEGKFRALLYRITAYYYNIINMLYFLSRVYLGRAIIDGDFENSIHRERVPLFLVHQALELLLKSALHAKCGRYPKSHNLSKLHDEFSAEFPEIKIVIPDAVLGTVISTMDLFPDDPAARTVQHERLRYPADKKGRLWGFREDLNLSASIDQIERLSMQFYPVWLEIRALTEKND